MKTSADAQIRVLERLTQKAAARLIGLADASSLRGSTTAPRNEDGTYDAMELVVWRVSNAPEPKLSAQEQELLWRSVEFTDLSRFAPALLNYLRDIEAKYGEAGLLSWAKRFEATVADVVSHQQRGQYKDGFYINPDRISDYSDLIVYCSECDRVRRNGKWVKQDAKDGDTDPRVTADIVCRECMETLLGAHGRRHFSV